jgi:septum formation protein
MKHYPLILGSSSPRRLDLLRKIGIEPTMIKAANIDETPQKCELPRTLALRLAIEKVNAIEPIANHFIISADTVVGVGRRILPKAETNSDVLECLNLMSGRSHSVFTGMAVKSPEGRILSRLSISKIKFKLLTSEEKSEYIASGEGIGKAGGYAIQGLAETYIKSIQGSYSGIVGLSLYDIRSMLDSVGFFKVRES